MKKMIRICLIFVFIFGGTIQVFATNYSEKDAVQNIYGDYVGNINDTFEMSVDEGIQHYAIYTGENVGINATIQIYSLDEKIELSWGEENTMYITAPGTYYMEYSDDEDTYDEMTYSVETGGRTVYKLQFEGFKKYEQVVLPDNVKITVGKSKYISYDTYPLDYYGEETWKSFNNRIVKIDDCLAEEHKAGLIPYKLGKTKLRVTLTDAGIYGETTIKVDKVKIILGTGATYDISKLISEISGSKKLQVKNKKILKLKGKKITTLKSGKTEVLIKSKKEKYSIIVEVIDQSIIENKVKDYLNKHLYYPDSLEIKEIKWDKTKTKCTIIYSALNLLGNRRTEKLSMVCKLQDNKKGYYWVK